MKNIKVLYSVSSTINTSITFRRMFAKTAYHKINAKKTVFRIQIIGFAEQLQEYFITSNICHYIYWSQYEYIELLSASCQCSMSVATLCTFFAFCMQLDAWRTLKFLPGSTCQMFYNFVPAESSKTICVSRWVLGEKIERGRGASE